MTSVDNKFKEIFLTNEQKVLEGTNRIRLLYLVAIIVLTFLSLAFVFGGYTNLKERMDNPFSNWVNVEVPMSKTNDKDYLAFEDKLSLQPVLDSFAITSQTDYKVGKWTIKPHLEEGYGFFESRTRTYTEDDDNLLRIVFEESNLYYTNPKLQEEDSTKFIVISLKLYKDLGFWTSEEKRSSESIHLLLADRNVDDLYHDVVVSHIVKELPGNAAILASPEMFHSLEGKPDIKFEDYCTDLVQSDDKLYFCSSKKVDLVRMDSLLPSKVVVEDLLLVDSLHMGVDGKMYKYQCLLRQDYPYTVSVDFPDSLSKRKLLKILNDDEYYPVANSAFLTNEWVDLVEDYRSFYFSDLSRVVPFRNFAKKYNFDINILQVESRNNFYLVSILAKFFITLIIILSLVTIILYLQNVVSNHLEKIKSNLGTLMAFGLSKKAIIRLYISVILRYFLKASIISFIILIVIYALNAYLIQSPYLDINNIYLPIVWCVLTLVLLLYFRLLIKKILFKSPGELIYQRD